MDSHSSEYRECDISFGRVEMVLDFGLTICARLSWYVPGGRYADVELLTVVLGFFESSANAIVHTTLV